MSDLIICLICAPFPYLPLETMLFRYLELSVLQNSKRTGFFYRKKIVIVFSPSVCLNLVTQIYAISNIRDTVQHASCVFLPFFFSVISVISLHSHLRQHVHNVDKNKKQRHSLSLKQAHMWQKEMKETKTKW